MILTRISLKTGRIAIDKINELPAKAESSDNVKYG